MNKYEGEAEREMGGIREGGREKRGERHGRNMRGRKREEGREIQMKKNMERLGERGRGNDGVNVRKRSEMG